MRKANLQRVGFFISCYLKTVVPAEAKWCPRHHFAKFFALP